MSEGHTPKDLISQNENIILVETNGGGHLEFLTTPKAVRWSNYPMLEFLSYID